MLLQKDISFLVRANGHNEGISWVTSDYLKSELLFSDGYSDSGLCGFTDHRESQVPWKTQTPQESSAQELAAACAVVQPEAFAMYVSELNISYSGHRETFPDSKQCSELQCHMKNFK